MKRNFMKDFCKILFILFYIFGMVVIPIGFCAIIIFLSKGNYTWYFYLIPVFLLIFCIVLQMARDVYSKDV